MITGAAEIDILLSSVRPGPQARGIEYIVTLSLGDRDLLGSPS